jgi:hypothetical protein
VLLGGGASRLRTHLWAWRKWARKAGIQLAGAVWKILRAELLTGRRFRLPRPDSAGARCLGDRRHTQRPHQAIAIAVPARRFQRPTAAATPVPTIQPRQPLTVGPTEITWRVSASGLIGVRDQQVSAGRHLAGQVVSVRLHPSVLQLLRGQSNGVMPFLRSRSSGA